MPLDLDLQELKRRVAETPGDSAAWLQLAVGFERCGAKADAVETYYRARALGAEAKVCAESLERLGARPSPWTHVSGDSERTFSAPVRGPRRGVVVAREASGWSDMRGVVVDADGSLIEVVGAAALRLDPFSLNKRTSWGPFPRGAAHSLVPIVAAGGLVFAGIGSLGKTLLSRLPSGAPDWQTLELAGGERFAAAAGSQLVLGLYDAASQLTRVSIFDFSEQPGDARLALQEVRAWSVDHERLAIFDGECVALFGLDGKERFRRAAAQTRRSLELLLAPGGRTIWREFRISDRDTATCWLQALDGNGDYVWSKNIESEPGSWSQTLALSPDGTAHLCAFGQLRRYSSDGIEISRRGLSLLGGLIVDREGVAYCKIDKASGWGLVAVAPDGQVLFRVEEPLTPLAIDSLGRLIAHTPQHALVAIE